MARRKARELAFQTLFQAQRGDHPLWEVWHDVRVSAAEQLDEDDDGAVYGDPLDHVSLEFAQQILQQFADHQAEVDEVLSSSLKGWTFSQMSQTDVTILRLALSELRYFPDIPAEVTIDVAVRIAKKFGGEESGRFVNGVLARLINPDDVVADVADDVATDVADVKSADVSGDMAAGAAAGVAETASDGVADRVAERAASNASNANNDTESNDIKSNDIKSDSMADDVSADSATDRASANLIDVDTPTSANKNTVSGNVEIDSFEDSTEDDAKKNITVKDDTVKDDTVVLS